MSVDGWRVGRNPPSVLCSICLIGEPAPRADVHRRLFPLSQHNGSPFHPCTSPPSGTIREDPSHHRHMVPAGYRFCAPTQALARQLTCYASAMWVEFPQNTHAFCDCSPTRHPSREERNPAIKADPEEWQDVARDTTRPYLRQNSLINSHSSLAKGLSPLTGSCSGLSWSYPYCPRNTTRKPIYLSPRSLHWKYKLRPLGIPGRNRRIGAFSIRRCVHSSVCLGQSRS